MIELIHISLKQQKKKIILLFIQFFIGFFALFYSVAMVENLLQYKEQIEKMVPLNTMQILDYTEYDVNESDAIIKKYQKSVEELKKSEEIEQVGVFQRNYFQPLDNDILIEGIEIYEDYLSMVDINLSKGSTEELVHYNGTQKEIPVVVTTEMAKTYPYDSEFRLMRQGSGESESMTYKVVGVMSEISKYFRGNMIPISDSVGTGDAMFFITTSAGKCESIEAYQYNTIIGAKKGKSIKSVSEEIGKIYGKNHIFIETMTLEEQVEEYYKGQRTFVMSISCFAGILLILSVLGCIGTLMASILQRKEEFGIYITLGFSVKKLMILVFYETLSIFMAAFIFSAIGCGYLLSIVALITKVRMNIRIISTGFICMVICVICSLLLPLRKIYELQPIEMIEERE